MNRAAAFFIVCAGVLGTALLLPGSAAAAWPAGSVVNVPLCTASGNQSGSVSVPDGVGGAIVAWWDVRNGNADIYAQRISAAGLVQWQPDGIAVCTAAGGQTDPTIVADGAGGAVVTWADYRTGQADIYAQRISPGGGLMWATDGVAVCTNASDQYNVVTTADGAGGVVVGWYDFSSGSGDLYAQKISAAGTVQWAAGGVVIAAAASNQQSPTIASDGAGGAIIAWQDYRASAFDCSIYAQRVSSAGTTQWAANGVVVCAAAGGQYPPVIVADGAGGAVIAWADNRAGWPITDMYAQKVSSGGGVQWAVNGVALCTAAGQQIYPAIAPDGAGGAIVAWSDVRNGNYDVYAQRIAAAGLVQWTANGAALCTAAGNQGDVRIAADGAGGVVATWTDPRTGSFNDIYAQKISAAGVLQWPVDGGAICTATGDQVGPGVVANSAGDVIVTWNDNRNGNPDIYAQGVASNGASLFTSPRITSIRDIANDQGGKVRLAWNRSALDAGPALEISLYGIWRQANAAAAQAALAGGAPLLDENKQDLTPKPGVYRATTEGDKTLYWEGVGTVAARGEPTYTFVAPTLQDSTSAGTAWTLFMVDAHLAFVPGFFDSAPVSGYSVDNLAPAAPTPFTGRYSGSATALHWGRSAASDLAGYQLYRGDSAGFVPGPANFVVAKADTGFVDHVAGSHYYQLYAVDIHGNLSACAPLAPQQTSPVPGVAPAALRLLPNVPNPFNPMTTLRFELPGAGTVRLSVFDVAGRRVRTLVDGALAAGSHEIVWDGRDAAGRDVGSGSYLARLEFGGQSQTVRMGLVR